MAPGEYALDYQLCEAAYPLRCDIATATVQVVAPPPITSHDEGAVDSATGGTTVIDVLANDVVRNDTQATLSNVGLVQYFSSSPNIALDVSDGSIDVVPGTAPGNYNFGFRICELVLPASCTSDPP